MIDVLVLAAALAQSATASDEQPRSTGIRFLARTAYLDGRSEYRDLRTISAPLGITATQSFYVSVPTTLCGPVLVSDHQPEGGAYVWHLGLGPVKYAPQSRVLTRGEVMITAQRIKGAAVSEPKVAALPSQNVRRTAEIDAITGVRPVAGCNAVAIAIEARLLPEPVEVKADTRPSYKLMEAEFWFVHKAPDGKETTQRQTVRMRNGGRADFYFDDMTLNANVADRTEPVTVEVFGTLDTGTVMSGNEVNISLKLTRRYINPKATALGIPPTVGKTDYPTTIDVGEVVSFLLPPLENDKGAFLGHRFSVRLRIKPVE